LLVHAEALQSIVDPATNTQEALAYLDQMVRACARQLRAAGG
jgi:hypothetical protein